MFSNINWVVILVIVLSSIAVGGIVELSGKSKNAWESAAIGVVFFVVLTSLYILLPWK